MTPREVLAAAHGRFGTRSFPVDPTGPNWNRLVEAERLGWVHFVADGRCAITAAGQRELEPHRLDMEKPVIEYICPTCLSLVPQYDRGDGLPENSGCPHCARKTATAVQKFQQTHGQHG